MNSIQDTMKLHNGNPIPCVGYGTYLTPIPDTREAVAKAIQIGYRHIDTAFFYGNEAGVGQAIRESGIPREEFFVTSKLWNDHRGYEQAKAYFEKTMENLGMDYLDLFLIHWPANYLQFGKEAKTINRETWRAFEELYQEGRIKAIGLSNFMTHHIEDLMETATVKPMVDQIEFHPGWNQRGVVKYCQDNDIIVEAWSPMGRSQVLQHETLVEMGKKYGKTPAQICLRWVMQHGVLPLPKSVTPDRMIANTQIFDFVISDADMQVIDALDHIGGQCARPDDVDF